MARIAGAGVADHSLCAGAVRACGGRLALSPCRLRAYPRLACCRRAAGARCCSAARSRECAGRAQAVPRSVRRRIMANSYDIIDHSFDVVVLGAGGAGLRATLGMVAAGPNTPGITQGFPTSSPKGAAPGGSSAAVGNMEKGEWRPDKFATDCGP